MSAIDWSPLWISLHTAAATITIVFFIGVIIAWWVERLSWVTATTITAQRYD